MLFAGFKFGNDIYFYINGVELELVKTKHLMFNEIYLIQRFDLDDQETFTLLGLITEITPDTFSYLDIITKNVDTVPRDADDMVPRDDDQVVVKVLPANVVLALKNYYKI